MSFLSALRRLLPARDAGNFIGFDKYRKRGAYHWLEIHDNPDYRALIEAILPFLRAEHVVLDIGCGDGAYLGLASSKVREAWGVDADADAIRLAREKIAEHGIANCRVENWRIDQAKERFAANGQRFDVVWSADVIEHLPRPQELLELGTLVLKPDGLLLIGTPLFVTAELVSPYHVKEFTRPEIAELLAASVRVEREIILPHTRKDGRVYSEGYYLAACRLKR